MSVFSVTGRLGRDGEVRTLQSGTKVLQFSIAEDRGFGEKKHTVWIKCALFGDRAEKLAPYLVKGKVVEAWGEVSANAYKGKDGSPQASLDLRVSEVKLHGGGNRDEPVADNGRATRGPAHAPDIDDDIPF
jgi:single-strand DNA-binding protein